MRPRKTRLEPEPPTVSELLKVLARHTRRFFAEHEDTPLPEELAGALPICERAAGDARMEQSIILQICASFVGRSAACEDMAVAALLDIIERQYPDDSGVAWTLDDLTVIVTFAEFAEARRDP